MTYLSFFIVVDADRSFGISPKEYKAFLRKPLRYLQRPIQYQFLLADKNGDGKISVSEAYAVLEKVPSLPVLLSHVDMSMCLPR